MNEATRVEHERLGAVFSDFESCDLPESYGDPDAEHRAVRAAAGVVDRSHRSRLSIGGGDRQDFLQRLVSNDVHGLVEGRGTCAALLTPKGRFISLLTIHDRGESYLVDSSAVTREKLFQKLSMYVLSADVTVEDVTDETASFGVCGPKAEEILHGLGGDGLPGELFDSRRVVLAGTDVVICRGDSFGETGFDLHLGMEGAGGLLKALVEAGAQPVGWRAAESLRIEAGIARFGAELDGDVLLPEVPALVERAVSYTKGCFVGQETLGRLRSRGHVNRELRGLIFEGHEVPEARAAIHVETHQVGEVTSACLPPTLGFPIALAFIHREHFEPGAEVWVECGEGAANAVLTLPGRPWRR